MLATESRAGYTPTPESRRSVFVILQRQRSAIAAYPDPGQLRPVRDCLEVVQVARREPRRALGMSRCFVIADGGGGPEGFGRFADELALPIEPDLEGNFPVVARGPDDPAFAEVVRHQRLR